jgi:hypothetical protein
MSLVTGFWQLATCYWQCCPQKWVCLLTGVRTWRPVPRNQLQETSIQHPINALPLKKGDDIPVLSDASSADG